jgi:hypothetical protein
MAGVKDLSFGKTMNGLQNFAWSGTLTGDKIVTNDIDILVKGTTPNLSAASAGNEIANKDYADSAHTGKYLKLDGTSEMTGDIDCGNQDIVDCKDIQLKGVTYQFPSSIGTANQVLTIDTVASPNTLKWASPAAVSGAIMADGSATVTANIPFNSNKITGLAAATTNGDAVRYNEFATLESAVALNTAKVGITAGQAAEITANTAKVGITAGQAAEITANTAKVGITAGQAAEITANTAKVGITAGQAAEITANTAKVGITAGQAAEITANTAKVGITAGQASAITANTAKVGITAGQAAEITANTAKVGITAGQASAITANTAKVGTNENATTTLNMDDNNITNIGSVSSYDLPNNRGTANYFLKTDGLGGTSWAATAGGGGALLTSGGAMDGAVSGSNVGITNLNGISLAYTTGGGAVSYTDIDGVGDINQFSTGTVTFGKTLLGAGYSFPTGSSTAGHVLALNPSDNTQLTFQAPTALGLFEETAAGDATKYDTVTIKGTQTDKCLSIGYNSATIERNVKLLVYEPSTTNIISREQLDYRVFDTEVNTNYFTLLEAWNGSGFSGVAGVNSLYSRGTGLVGSAPCIGFQSHIVGEVKGTATNEMFINRGSVNVAYKLSVGQSDLLAKPESPFFAQGAIDITPSQRGIHAGDYTASSTDYGALEIVGNTGGFIDFHKADGLGATQGRIITNHTTGTLTAGGLNTTTLNTLVTGLPVLTMTGNVVADYEQGLYFLNSAFNQYGIAREAGAWATSPKLRIAFGTGIKFVTSNASNFEFNFDSVGVASPLIQFRPTGSIISEFNPIPRITAVVTSLGGVTHSRNVSTVNRNATGYYTVYWAAGIFTGNRYTAHVTPIGAWYRTASTYLKNNTNVSVLISANVSGTAAPVDCPFDITITGW